MFLKLIPSTLNRAILAAVLFIAGVLPSQAQQWDGFSYRAYANAVEITFYEGYASAVTIPSSIDGLPVASISRNAFINNNVLTSVAIPSSVNSIGDWAFSNCTNLTSVSIPNSVTSIGSSVFYGCTGLTSVTLGNSVTSIGSLAFEGCSRLTNVTVDSANPNYSSMAGVLFNKNQSTLIQYPGGKTGSYTIPSSVTSIGDWAFSNCTNLTSVLIPNSVTSIGIYAFTQCGLTSVTIPNSVTNIGNRAFENCSRLTSVTIPNSVTSFGMGAFSSCWGLTSVTIPNSVTSISNAAFSHCYSLKSVTIPNSVTNIGTSAFAQCGLTSVTIPNSVTSIGIASFWQCTSLTSVYFQGNAPTTDSSAFAAFANTYATIYYYAGKTGWGSTYAGRPTVQLVSISSQPVSVTALRGTSASFTVTASGATSYQWQKNSVNISSATTATLTLSNVQSTDAANYQVIIYNPAGNLTSNAATLTVLTDTDGDRLSDADEINIYHTNPLLKDSDGDGFDDGFEVNAKFNPNLASSSPESALSISSGPGTVTFRFNAGLGLSYRIEDSTDLQNWNTLESPIVGAGVEVTRYYPVAGQPKRYFRVKKNS